MKSILLFVFLFIPISIVFAQSKDSIVVVKDTINVRGKVIDDYGKPVFNALVFSEDLEKSHQYVQTKTNKDGVFYLYGVTPKNTIRVRTKEAATELLLKGSRYLLITLSNLSKQIIKSDEQRLDISAKRTSTKPKFSFKIKDTVISIGFHPFGHYWPASYAGGINKFYNFIQKNIVYPKKAIENNVEGTVIIEFTIGNTGNLKDFLVIRDIGYGCAEEVIRVIKISKKWEPAMNGLSVDQRTVVEIPFKLFD